MEWFSVGERDCRRLGDDLLCSSSEWLSRSSLFLGLKMENVYRSRKFINETKTKLYFFHMTRASVLGKFVGV